MLTILSIFHRLHLLRYEINGSSGSVTIPTGMKICMVWRYLEAFAIELDMTASVIAFSRSAIKSKTLNNISFSFLKAMMSKT